MIGMGAAIFTGEYDIAQIMLKTGLGVVGLTDYCILHGYNHRSWMLTPQEFPVFPFLLKIQEKW